MPASEEPYRRQPTLHLVFAISSVAMLLSTVWMVMADHLRPWKEVQRQFHEVERDKLEAAEQAEARRAEDEISGADRRNRRQDQGGRGQRRERAAEIVPSIESSGSSAAKPSSSTSRRGSRRPSSTASAASTTA